MTHRLRSSNWGRRGLLTVVLAGLAVLTIGVAVSVAAIVPATNDAAGAGTIASAIKAPATTGGAASFESVPPVGTPNGIANSALGPFFPTNGSTFGILTSGDVNLADDANDAGSSGASLGHGPVRGVSDLDVSILKIPVTVPAGANCLRFEFQFLSEEFPEFVGSSVNDAFVAELDTSNWTTTSGSAPPSAPNNFAFDSEGNVVSINSSGATTGVTVANAAGTTYDGATRSLSAATPVTAGAHTLFLSVFDQGDTVWDSAVFIDNLVVGFVANPTEECEGGAQPGGLPGRVVGKGAASGGGKTASYAYILNCEQALNTNAPFEARYTGGQVFRLTSVDSVNCTDDPDVTTQPSGFDTQSGTGTGTINGVAGAKVDWTFVDGGLGGASDRVSLTIRNAAGAVQFQGSAAPPGKFPGSTQATGNNVSYPPPSGNT